MRSAICDELPKTEEGAVLFGQNPETGEAAEWLVIEQDNIEQDRNITTLLAKECLGYHCFNHIGENGNNFAGSDIAAYLNTDILKACFSEEEQDRIIPVALEWEYLLNVTFYAGSNAIGDTDKGIYIISMDKEMTENDMKEVFFKVNALLNENVGSSFSLSYEQGINIDTLMRGVELYTKGMVEELQSDCGNVALNSISNYYRIEQWQ